MVTDFNDRLLTKPLYTFLRNLHPLSDAFVSYHQQHCDIIEVKKTKFILSPIDQNNAMYFILKGLVRGFVKEGKKDISTWFGFEQDLVSAVREPSSLHSVEYLQAIEDCILIRIPYQLMDLLHIQFPEINPLQRKISELRYHAASERSILARIPNAMDRFKKLEQSGIDHNRVPLRYLASYLGIRLETLSRIRSKQVTTTTSILKIA